MQLRRVGCRSKVLVETASQLSYISFFIFSSSSANSALLSLMELTAARHDCLSLYSSMSRGFSWCHRALNLSSSCWKACTLDSTLLFITSTCQTHWRTFISNNIEWPLKILLQIYTINPVNKTVMTFFAVKHYFLDLQLTDRQPLSWNRPTTILLAS